MKWRLRLVGAALTIATTTLTAAMASAPPAHAGANIIGAGSTWSANILKQWVADVNRFGIKITFSDIGATAGRQLFMNGQSDFAVSPIPFQPTETPVLQSRGMQYAYLPIVAGGTSFMYNLRGITDLKLSQRTATKIFTGQITQWNDPQIVKDTGHSMPNERIIPVVRADSSGTSAVLSQFFLAQAPDLWNAFMKAMNYPPGFTQQWPQFPGALAANLSEGVADLVNRTEGGITYVETSYAIQRSKPVAFVQNQAGRYSLPTAENVAIALTAARLNPDRTQVLTGVYRNPDPSAYPISSYDYLIVRTDRANLDSAKGKDLSRFVYYSVCVGQQKAVGGSGYSPLPKNLVQAAFDGARLMPGADPPPAINTCKNPTITGGFQSGRGGSSQPPPTTAPPTTAPPTNNGNGQNGNGQNSGNGQNGNGQNSGNGQNGNGQNGSGVPTTAGPSGSNSGTGGTNGPNGGGASGSAGGSLGNERLLASPTVVTVKGSTSESWVLVAAALTLLLLLFVPPLVLALSTTGPARRTVDRNRERNARLKAREDDAIRSAFESEA